MQTAIEGSDGGYRKAAREPRFHHARSRGFGHDHQGAVAVTRGTDNLVSRDDGNPHLPGFATTTESSVACGTRKHPVPKCGPLLPRPARAKPSPEPTIPISNLHPTRKSIGS